MTAALRCGDEALSVAEIEQGALRLAASLAAAGIGEGDVFAIMLRNEPRFMLALLAARVLGAYAVPVNWHFKGDEAGYILADSGARVVLIHADLHDAISGFVPPGIKVVLLDSPASPPTAMAAEKMAATTAEASMATMATARTTAPAAVPGAAETHAWDEWLSPLPYSGPRAAPRPAMSYTSGTTGRPKGVRRMPLTDGHLRRIAAVNAQAFGIRPGIRALVTTPLYHSAPNAYATSALQQGELLVIEPRFDAERTLALIERHRITHAYLVPTLFVRLLRLPGSIRSRYDLSSLEFVLHGAAPCPPEVKRGMIEWWGPVINDFYGGSEAGPVTCTSSGEWLARPGTVGRPVANVEIMICDDAGHELPAGTAGTIYVRQGNHPDFTYHHNDAMRAEAEHPLHPGFITLGDVGYRDAEGYLFLSDRKKDLVISGGVNIYPAEIEAVLAGMPGVRDCAVFGIPDSEFGEALLAVVECDDPALTEDAVRHFLRERIAGYKVPRRVEFAASLPREESGKIFKRRLREPYWRDAGRAI